MKIDSDCLRGGGGNGKKRLAVEVEAAADVVAVAGLQIASNVEVVASVEVSMVKE